MSLLKSPEMVRVENQLISLFDHTMERAFRLRTTGYERELVHNVRREFDSKTYVKQLDNIITAIIKQSLLYADNQLKQMSTAAIEDSYVITEEAVRISTELADNVVESIVHMFKDDAIYTTHPNQLARRIVESWEGERYKAVRFARTFTADVATNTTVYRYRQRGVEYVEFDAELDDRTSDQCRALHGTVFDLSKGSVDLYRPPLHHSCRSGLKIISIHQQVDTDKLFENRDFSSYEKAFKEIDVFNKKYRINKFVLDADIETRLAGMKT